jgi:hypothetical protein
LMLPQIRRSIAKATRQEFSCSRTQLMDEVHACLTETEQRQHFDQHIDVDDLRMLQRSLGEDVFRAYICRSKDGEPASASIELHRPGGEAIGWLAGTRSEFVGTGSTQLLKNYVLSDLAGDGACSYDWGGANVQSVAMSKSQWGGNLVPFYRLEGIGIADLARHVRKHWRFRRTVQ